MEKSPLKAIRAKCLECCCGSAYEVKNCTIHDCNLYPYRLGNNPFRTRSMTDEQKQAVAERLKSARLAKKSLTNNEENSDQLIRQGKCRVRCLGKFIDYQCMIILLSCLGSFAAGVAIGMLIVYLYWCRIERELNETIEKTLNRCNLTLDK